MTTDHITCELAQDALVAGPPSDAHQRHLTSCPTCRGVSQMTDLIRTELEPVPAAPGQRPQWIAELHVRAARRRKRLIWGASALAVAAAASALVAIAARPAPSPRDDQPVVSAIATTTPRASATRPAWITSDVPFTGSCTRSACVGISAFRATKAEAVAEAREVAYEALSESVADRIHSPMFDRHVRPAYEPARVALVKAFASQPDHGVPTIDETYQRLADARHRAAVALVADAGALVPRVPSDWYWEEYANDTGVVTGAGTSFIAYVRFDLDDTLLDRLAEIYRVERARQSERVVTAFPLLAFAYADFDGGYVTIDRLVDGLRAALRPRRYPGE